MPEPRIAPSLTDGDVTLRAHRPADAEGSWEQSQDPLSQRWTTVPVPYDMTDAATFVGEVMPRGWADGSEWGFAIEYDGRYAGTVSLRDQGSARAEIAYGSHPAVRGTGVVERALRLLLEWGFAEQRLETVLWMAHTGNWASRRVAWRLGFSCDGTLRQWAPQRGELRDVWIGTLHRGEPREPRTTWLACPVVEAYGVRLRPIVAADAPRIQEACSDERTQRWLGQLASPYTRADAEAYVESRTAMLADARGETWAVTEPGDDRILGSVGWFDHRPGVGCEIGYWAHPDARGRGVTTRALAAVTDHVIATLGVPRVTCFAAVGNTASRHVIEANGFQQYGVERLGARVRDGRADLALYDVLADEWPSRRPVTG
ncbi:GNAT family N-acetyltransferase [Nocardioides lianchengensis]|uniref:Protein N-acetyltransferase, RimJ/RimL family n=1 Tax=Nocardioides lianchengensis TaxID=1045774 RepID=A0A1G6IWH8_9ACTN|nr:GNAT family N-acetyltransferase [Nocardioides lianchengensis]NYG12928.1 RimJ/RimL family protein N-acetyltransferase [Nocardioides lianchengensis]SDC10780.1 Protein N-acetyltransferase, RimJ/RimL family [Nocardioides lianchengensis]